MAKDGGDADAPPLLPLLLPLVILQIGVVLWLYHQALCRNTDRLRNYLVTAAGDDRPGGQLRIATPPTVETPYEVHWVCTGCRRRALLPPSAPRRRPPSALRRS